MPKICEFYGVEICMYHNEHGPPHFHAYYADSTASVSFEGRVLRGKLPPRVLRLVREWTELRRAELVENWSRARKERSLVQIAPLE